MKTRIRNAAFLAAVVSIFVASLILVGLASGCASTGATTQPSLATLTTQTEASVDAAVIVLTIGVETKAISNADYWAYVNPAVLAAQAAVQQMQASANSGDVSGATTASNAALAAVAQLAPYIEKAKASQPAIKATSAPSN